MAGVDDRGSSAVGFALVVPLLIGRLLGIARVGVVVMYKTAVTDAARDVARAVSLGRLDTEEAETTLEAELDSLLPDGSVETGHEPSEPTILVSEEADAVVSDVTVPLRDLLWSPLIGEALGSIRTTVRTLKPGA